MSDRNPTTAAQPNRPIHDVISAPDADVSLLAAQPVIQIIDGKPFAVIGDGEPERVTGIVTTEQTAVLSLLGGQDLIMSRVDVPQQLLIIRTSKDYQGEHRDEAGYGYDELMNWGDAVSCLISAVGLGELVAGDRAQFWKLGYGMIADEDSKGEMRLGMAIAFGSLLGADDLALARLMRAMLTSLYNHAIEDLPFVDWPEVDA